MSTILDNLNQRQQEAVTFDKGPLLILAGAGSGKTRVLTHRAAWLIQKKAISPENMLLLTFTNKAAGEMKERIRRLLTSAPYSIPHTPYAGTFHSFCCRVLRIGGKHIGLPPHFVIYDQDDQKDAIKQILTRLNFADKAMKPTPILSVISAAKSELVDVATYEKIAGDEWQKRIAMVYRLYQKFLLEAGAVDFDDLLIYAVKLLKEFPETLTRFQDKYKYILVDEWQDTNAAQYQLTKLLAQKHKNLTVVGDAAQSVYSWRGADHRNLDYLARDFSDITTINLEQNYRSTQTILDAAYNVISKNTTHPILKLWTNNGGGEKLTLYQARTEQDEASFIVNEILRLRTRHHSLKDFAILYRTNAQSRTLEEALLHAGIPYTLVGAIRFYARREIKDVISYLRLVVNDQDPVSKARAEKLGKARLAKFAEITRRFTTSNSKISTLEILDAILDRTGYLDLYDPDDPEDAARLENIKELRSVAAEFPNLVEFLEQIALVENAQNERGVSRLENDAARPERTRTEHSQSSRGVTLMTAHAAKGLEFPVVFIAGLEEGLFPHSKSVESREELEEERRLCYVGMTRAKRKLYLTYAARRLIFGQRSNSIPSRFLSDIPESLYENSNEGLPLAHASPWLYDK